MIWIEALQDMGDEFVKNMIEEMLTNIENNDNSLIDNALTIDMFEQIVLNYIKDELQKVKVHRRSEEPHDTLLESDVCNSKAKSSHSMGPSRLLMGEAITNFVTTINNQTRKFNIRKVMLNPENKASIKDDTRLRVKLDAQRLAVLAVGTLVLFDYLEYTKEPYLNNSLSEKYKAIMLKLPATCNFPIIHLTEAKDRVLRDTMQIYFHDTFLDSVLSDNPASETSGQCYFSYNAVKALTNHKKKNMVELVDEKTFKLTNVKILIDSFKACSLSLSKAMYFGVDIENVKNNPALNPSSSIITPKLLIKKLGAGVKSLYLDASTDFTAELKKVVDYLGEHLLVLGNPAEAISQMLIIN